MTPILPLTIEPAGSRAFSCVCTVLISALLTSGMWYWLLLGERAVQDKLLAELWSRQPEVIAMTLKFANGQRQQVNIVEGR